ncbi:hypothetical protein ACEQ8H_007058 [Pleosporales sp. CAS-2024a]
MAFVLTPRLAPVAFCAPVSRSPYAYRVARPRPQRPQYSSFSHFFNQVDQLLREIDGEAQRQAHIEAVETQAHRQRQLPKPALRADFAVTQTEQGWQVAGEIHGFDQHNISIEASDEHTLKIAANTEWQTEKTPRLEEHSAADAVAATEQSSGAPEEPMNMAEPESDSLVHAEAATATPSTPDSDTQSHASYQATVEDDFEHVDAETSSLIATPSRPSSPAARVKEPKGKEKAAEESEVVTQPQPQPEPPIRPQPEPQQEERLHGSFARTFRFPERIDVANISASFKDGSLRVTIPKAPTQRTRRIAIL